MVSGKIHEAVPTEMEGLDVIPADKNLIGVNFELVDVDDREIHPRQPNPPQSASNIPTS